LKTASPESKDSTEKPSAGECPREDTVKVPPDLSPTLPTQLLPDQGAVDHFDLDSLVDPSGSVSVTTDSSPSGMKPPSSGSETSEVNKNSSLSNPSQITYLERDVLTSVSDPKSGLGAFKSAFTTEYVECRPLLVSKIQSFSRAMEYIYHTPIIAISAKNPLDETRAIPWSRPFNCVDGLMPSVLLNGTFLSFQVPAQELSVTGGEWLLPQKVLAQKYEFDHQKYSYFLTAVNRIARVDRVKCTHSSYILIGMADQPRVTGVNLLVLLNKDRLLGNLIFESEKPEDFSTWLKRFAAPKLKCHVTDVTDYRGLGILSNDNIVMPVEHELPYFEEIDIMVEIDLMRRFYSSQVVAFRRAQPEGKCSVEQLVKLCDIILDHKLYDHAQQLIDATQRANEAPSKPDENQCVTIDFNNVHYVYTKQVEIVHQSTKYITEFKYGDIYMPHFQTPFGVMSYPGASNKILIAIRDVAAEQCLEWRFGRGVIKLETRVRSYSTRRSSRKPKNSYETFSVNSWLYGFLPYVQDPGAKSFRRLMSHIVNAWMHERLRVDIVRPVSFRANVKFKVSPESDYVDFDTETGKAYDPGLTSLAGLFPPRLLDTLEGLSLDFSGLVTEGHAHVLVGSEKFAWTEKSVYRPKKEGENLRDYVVSMTLGKKFIPTPETADEKPVDLDLIGFHQPRHLKSEASLGKPKDDAEAWQQKVTTLFFKEEEGALLLNGKLVETVSELFKGYCARGGRDLIKALVNYRHGQMHRRLKDALSKDTFFMMLLGRIPKFVTLKIPPEKIGGKIDFCLFSGHDFRWKFG
jgi:hypothetical protein